MKESGIIIIAILCAVQLTTMKAISPRPNILLIVADDYGWHDVGYHGSVIETPNLDKLASDGVKLENYYVQPICTPTRSQLMSGRYQAVVFWSYGWKILDFMRNQGYYTGAEDYFTHIRETGYDLRRNEEEVAKEYAGQYSAFVFTKEIQNIIRQHNTDKPLFMYLPFQSVHAPLQVPSQYSDKYKEKISDSNRRQLAGMVTCMDEGIGNITATLKESSLWNNTLTIFSTDNGGQVYTGGNNWPFRGWKASLWEGGVHGVGFVHSPLIQDEFRGTVHKGLIHVSDWFPTLVNLAGGVLNGTKPLDGFDQWEAISKGSASPRTELLHNIDPLFSPPKYMTNITSWHDDMFNTSMRSAIRVGDWKLITGDPGNGSWIPPPESGQKPIISPDKPGKHLWLFNIKDDPNEKFDLSNSQPAKVKELLTKLAAYYETAVPVRFPDPDPRSDPSKHGGAWGPWQ